MGIKMPKASNEHLISHYIHRKYLKKGEEDTVDGMIKRDFFSVHRPQNFHYVFP